MAQGSGKAAAPAAAAQAGDAQLGQSLFDGQVRFANRGPACNACHNVTNNALMGGGLLGPDLTNEDDAVLDSLTAPDADLASFSPAMKAAYSGGAFTQPERAALVVFFKKVKQEASGQAADNWQLKSTGFGIVGFVVLAALAGLFGRNRKRASVNKDIYDRQLQSQ